MRRAAYSTRTSARLGQVAARPVPRTRSVPIVGNGRNREVYDTTIASASGSCGTVPAVNAPPLPEYNRAAVQRILDREARRLLTEGLDGDAVGAPAGSDGRASDHCLDEIPASIETEAIPVGRADHDPALVTA